MEAIINKTYLTKKLIFVKTDFFGINKSSKKGTKRSNGLKTDVLSRKSRKSMKSTKYINELKELKEIKEIKEIQEINEINQ